MINCSRLLMGHLARSGPRYESHPAPIVFWNPARDEDGLACNPAFDSAPDGEELSTAECLAFLQDLVSMRVPMVTWEGENFLSRLDIYHLARYVSDLGLRLILATGGRHLDAGVARKIREAGISYVGLNMDPPSRNGEYTGLADAFRKLLPAVRALQGEGMMFGVKVTLTRFDRGEVTDLFVDMKTAGVKRVAVYHWAYHDGSPGWEEIRRERRRLIEFLIGETERCDHDGFDFEIVTEDNYTDGPFIFLDRRRKDPERSVKVARMLRLQGGCGAARKLIFVDHAGFVHPCPSWRHLTLGNVRERPLSDIWDNLGFKEKMQDKRRYLKGRCSDCRFNALCGGCRVRADLTYGDCFAQDPACYLTDEEIKPAAIALR